MRKVFTIRTFGVMLCLAGIFFFFSAARVSASATLGTIDPNNTGAYLAQLVNDPGLGSGSDKINFGKFISQSGYNITVSSNGLRGFAWGAGTGWIVVNCQDTTSGCSGTNGNFKVSVASDGTLSGYAWGQHTGWINFGPFTNSATPQVKINSLGVFAGTSGSAGYAWSQNFGWIKFDCTNTASCTVTDYVPTAYVTPPGGGTPAAACSDGIDNDGDGLIDYPNDPGCTSAADTDETNAPVATGPYGGSPAVIPGTIQAENYDLGGPGVAYNDTTAGNTGGAYRSDDVDVENGGGGVIDVGWTTNNEWLKYSVKVLTTGSYKITASIATPNAGKTLRVEMDGSTIATFTTVNTGWWQTYQPIVVTNVPLTAGSHTLRFVFVTGSTDPNWGYNLDYVKFELGQPNVPPTVSITSPTNGQSFTAPATISIAATAADTDGTIKQVSFYNGATLISTDTSSPFTAATAPLSAGTYTLTAKATDNQDAVTTSNPITITVTNVPAPACSDSIDNDGDGLIDYPNDPGCTSAADTDETNAPVAPTEPTMPTGPVAPPATDGSNNSGGGGSGSGGSGGTGGSSGGIDTPPVSSTATQTTEPIGPIQPPRGETPPGAISPSLIPSLSRIVEITPPIRQTTNAIAVVSLGVSAGVGVSSSILLAPFLFSDLWGLLFAFFGWRKKKWGVVYDSKTKQPIDPAYVVLRDMAGNEIATSITDLQGRYGFLVSPGVYTISVNKTHYEFPSKRLSGHDHDAVYDSLYFGGPITVERSEETIFKNIPLDPLAVDWNEVAKREQGFLHFFARHEHMFRMIANGFFIAGFIVAIAAYLISPILRNLLVIVVYVAIYVLQHLNVLKPRTGTVVDARNKGVPYALVEVYNAHINQKVTTKITSAHGRFLALVPKGTYYAKVYKRDSTDTETYTPIVTTQAFDAPHGYIEQEISVPIIGDTTSSLPPSTTSIVEANA